MTTQFYGTAGKFQDYYLELPIKELATKAGQPEKEKAAALKEHASLVKARDIAYLNNKNNVYKTQRKNFIDNANALQDNYQTLFEAEQANAQKEFEGLAKARGQAPPNSAINSLMGLAPGLANLAGEYIQQNEQFKINSITDWVINNGITNEQVELWKKNENLIKSNTLESQLFVKAHAEKYGVVVSAEDMLSAVRREGDYWRVQKEAMNLNSAKNYAGYIRNSGDTEIVLDGGVTKPWSQIRNGNSSEEFALGLRQLQGKWLAENDIDITTENISNLRHVGENLRKVEDGIRGEFSRGLKVKNERAYEQHQKTEFYNAVDTSTESLVQWRLKQALLLGRDGKFDFNAANEQLYDYMAEGVQTGAIRSTEITSLLASKDNRFGKSQRNRFERLRDIAQTKEQTVADNHSKSAERIQEEAVDEAVRVFYDDWGGQMRGGRDELEVRLREVGLSEQSISKFWSRVGTKAGEAANSPNEKYKSYFDNGLKSTYNYVPLDPNEITLIDKETWQDIPGANLLKNQINSYYQQQFDSFYRQSILSGTARANEAAQQATKATADYMHDNTDLFKLNPSTRKEQDAEGNEIELQLTTKERSFVLFTPGNIGDFDPARSRMLSRLNDDGNGNAVNPKDRMIGIEDGTYDAVLDRNFVSKFYRNGKWDHRRFKNDSLIHDVVNATGLPASLILDIHAQEFGLDRPDPENVITLDEWETLPKAIKNVIAAQSSVATEIQTAHLNNTLKNMSHYSISGGNPGFSKYIPPAGRLQGIGGSRHNISREELAYAVNTIMGEAGPDDDKYYVLAVILNRKAANPNLHIRDIVSAPNQFVGYQAGRQIDQQLLDDLMSNDGMAKTYEAQLHLGNRTQFRGRSLYKNMGKGDIRPNDKSNYYFYGPQAAGAHVKYNPAWHSNAWQSIWSGDLNDGNRINGVGVGGTIEL